MQPTSIAFAQGAFLVEVEPDFRDVRPADFVVHIPLLEDGGNVLRPLVKGDGDRVVIHAPSEPLAWNSAIHYLRKRFGGLSGPMQPWHPHHLRWGQPVVIEG